MAEKPKRKGEKEMEEQNTNTQNNAENNAENNANDVAKELEALKIENAKLRKATDKATSEAADFKRQLREKLSADEIAENERKEADAKREEEYRTLKRENSINKFEKTYLGMGFTPEEASRMAIAEADGDVDARIKTMQEVDARKKKDYEREFLKSRPGISAGAGVEGASIDKKTFDKMGYSERMKLFNENPDLYKSLI